MASYDLGDLFAQVENEIKEVPEGQYVTEIVNANVTATQAGKPMLNLEHKVLSGPFAGASVVQRQVISPENPQALQIFFRAMRSLGIKDEVFKAKPAPPLEAVGKSLVGKRCGITVKVDDFGSKVQKATLQGA